MSTPHVDLLSSLHDDPTTPHNNNSPCSDNNSDEQSHHTTSAHNVGCQSSSLLQNPVTVIKEVKKISLPYFDPSKMTWSAFAMKLHASLIKCDLAYLLHEKNTNHVNASHSKELMLEFFKKLQGSTLSIFMGMNTQHYYLEGGCGIEMKLLLTNSILWIIEQFKISSNLCKA
jgi:hypothetical protein